MRKSVMPRKLSAAACERVRFADLEGFRPSLVIGPLPLVLPPNAIRHDVIRLRQAIAQHCHCMPCHARYRQRLRALQGTRGRAICAVACQGAGSPLVAVGGAEITEGKRSVLHELGQDRKTEAKTWQLSLTRWQVVWYYGNVD